MSRFEYMKSIMSVDKTLLENADTSLDYSRMDFDELSNLAKEGDRDASTEIIKRRETRFAKMQESIDSKDETVTESAGLLSWEDAPEHMNDSMKNTLIVALLKAHGEMEDDYNWSQEDLNNLNEIVKMLDEVRSEVARKV